MKTINFSEFLNGTVITVNVNNAVAKNINACINANLAKIKKLAKVQRPKLIMKLVKEAAPFIMWSKGVTNDGFEMFTGSLTSDVIKDVKRAGKTVYQFDKNGNLVATYPSVQAAHRATGIADSSICYCANNKYGFKTAGGYKWSYNEAV